MLTKAEWRTFAQLLRKIHASPLSREEKRMIAEQELEKAGGMEAKRDYDYCSSLNLDGADEIIGDEEFEQMKRREESNGPQVHRNGQPSRKIAGLKVHSPSTNGDGHEVSGAGRSGPSLFDD